MWSLYLSGLSAEQRAELEQRPLGRPERNFLYL